MREGFIQGWPTCALCGKPVERLAREADPVRAFLVLVAFCHGEREVVEVPEELIEAADGVRLGVAFQTRTLSSAAEELSS